MNEKRYVVPDGMVEAFNESYCAQYGCAPHSVHSKKIGIALQAAIRWLAENPIRPDYEQVGEMSRHFTRIGHGSTCEDYIAEWQRRMFCAPEPEVPEAVKELRSQLSPDGNYDAEVVGDLILEAYRRGVRYCTKEEK